MTTCKFCHRDDGEHQIGCPMRQRPAIDALDSVRRVSDSRAASDIRQLRARIAVLEPAAARADNADQAAAAAYEVADQLRRVVKDMAEKVLAAMDDRDAALADNVTLALALEECQRRGGSYRREIETWRNLVTSIRLLAEKAEKVSGRVLRERIDIVVAEIENEANKEQ